MLARPNVICDCSLWECYCLGRGWLRQCCECELDEASTITSRVLSRKKETHPMSKVHCADQPVLPAHKLQSPAESGLVRPTPVHCRPTVHGTLYTVHILIPSTQRKPFQTFILIRSGQGDEIIREKVFVTVEKRDRVCIHLNILSQKWRSTIQIANSCPHSYFYDLRWWASLYII